MEQYGDIHLHQSDYPDYPGTYTYDGKCKYNALDHELYDKIGSGTPLGMKSCHVEYCHPGSWQGKSCGKVKKYTPDSDFSSCKSGVFGDEPVGKYEKYYKGETQYGSMNQPVAEKVMADDYMSPFKILLWLFVLIVGLIVAKNLWTRFRQ